MAETQHLIMCPPVIGSVMAVCAPYTVTITVATGVDPANWGPQEPKGAKLATKHPARAMRYGEGKTKTEARPGKKYRAKNTGQKIQGKINHPPAHLTSATEQPHHPPGPC
jgi:hypothetical protein